MCQFYSDSCRFFCNQLYQGPESQLQNDDDDEALLDIVQNSLFSDAVAAVNITNFPISLAPFGRQLGDFPLFLGDNFLVGG
jgi:hypothetical protein